MNIAIVGSKNVKKLADVLYRSFDTINVVGYPDVDKFRHAMVSRPLEFHRMILLEAAVSSEEVSSDSIYDFQDMVFANYPAMKIITISTNTEYTKFLASLFNGSNYGHFCFPSLKGKILLDIASKDIPELYKIYRSFAYREEVESKEEILDDNKILTETYVENKEEIEGYIAPTPEVKKPKGFLSGLFGRKEAGNLTMDSGLERIGQGTGITEFSEGVQGIDFSGEEKQDNSDIFEDNTEYPSNDIFENYPEEQEGFDFFDKDVDRVALGAGEIETSDIVSLDVDNTFNNGYNNFNNNGMQSGFVPYRQVEETNDEDSDIYTPNLSVEEDETGNQNNENSDINIPVIGLDSLKKAVEDTDFTLPSNIQNQPNLYDFIEVEDADVGTFDGDMSALMSEYENINNKPKEVVVEKIKVIERGGSLSFRNKNGIKIVIVSGDRRVGSTKLALNLANKYAINEKVLFVDFDRNRHGSLSYLDFNNILEEPEHIQNGFNHLRNLNILRNVCHYYKKGKFFTLFSMYGERADDAHMRVVQDVLASQRDYTTIVIDCPLEDLHLLENIVPFARVLFCVEDDRVGIINFLTSLSSTFESDNKLFTFFEKSHFVIGRKGNIQKFKAELNYVVDMFGLDEGMCQWNNVEIICNIRDLITLIERTGD